MDVLKIRKNQLYNIPIEMIEIETGKTLRIFKSINEASIKTQIPRKSIEAVVQNKHNMKQAGGYSWKKLVLKPTDNLWKIEEICNLYVLNQ